MTHYSHQQYVVPPPPLHFESYPQNDYRPFHQQRLMDDNSLQQCSPESSQCLPPLHSLPQPSPTPSSSSVSPSVTSAHHSSQHSLSPQQHPSSSSMLQMSPQQQHHMASPMMQKISPQDIHHLAAASSSSSSSAGGLQQISPQLHHSATNNNSFYSYQQPHLQPLSDPNRMHSQSGLSVSSPTGLAPLQNQSPVSGDMNHSPGYNMGHYQLSVADSSGAMLSHHALSTRHICAICGDRASGKHYGVFSCEGCKGFFKRTVRKDLHYTCRDDRCCLIDKRQRNRCQYCRYQKCLASGMKREAVQEERQRARERNEDEPESSCLSSPSLGAPSDMPVSKILEAELAVEPETETYIDVPKDPVTNICHAADKQLFSLVEWAKRVPSFTSLPLEDQVILLKAGWSELLIAAFSYRSIVVTDGILLSTGRHVHRQVAHQAGVGTIFDRILVELVGKLRDIKMDRTELGCLRAIILFNPDVKNIKSRSEIEALRDKVYAALEAYCRCNYPDEPGRFAKLLLRLPALRSIGLKCLEHLFFFRLIGDTPIDTFLTEMLENSASLV